MKEYMEKKGSKILNVKDEKEFYSLIEERLEEQGFEVFETSPQISREIEYVRFF